MKTIKNIFISLTIIVFAGVFNQAYADSKLEKVCKLSEKPCQNAYAVCQYAKTQECEDIRFVCFFGKTSCEKKGYLFCPDPHFN